jgi:hypothetical protein
MLLQTGIIRMALLNADGSKATALYLPPPNRDGLSLEWARKANTWELLDGSERTRLLGYLPVLTCKWTVYDDRPGQGYPIGLQDGQRPPLESLLWYLSQPTGKIKVSPGLQAGGFVADSIQVQPISKAGSIYTGLQVVFRGRDTLPTMTLGVF